MATATETNIDAAIDAVLSRFKVKIALKSEQHLALKAFIQKRDVFCVLPTGFGKSLSNHVRCRRIFGYDVIG